MAEIEQTTEKDQEVKAETPECQQGCSCRKKRGTHPAQMRQLAEMLLYSTRASTQRMEVLEDIAQNAAKYVSLIVLKDEAEADNFSEEDAENLSKSMLSLIVSLQELAKINLPDFLSPHIVNTREFQEAAAAFYSRVMNIPEVAATKDPREAEVEQAKDESMNEFLKSLGLKKNS